jgi:hypothetical protein
VPLLAVLAVTLATLTPPPGAAQPPPVGPLGGPRVARQATRPTLLSYDLSGRVRRLQTAPEIAAIELLHLAPGLQAGVDAVVGARAAAMDRFVSENLLLLSQLDTASKANDRLGAAVLLLEGFNKLRPALKDGPLRDRIARALPPAAAARFHALYSEYWSALVAESVRDNRAQGKHDPRWAIDLGEHLKELGQEITRAYERQAASGTLFIDYLLSDLDLSDRQRRTIETLKLDMLARTNMRPSEKDQKQLGLGILAYLNERQRLKVIKKIAGR